MGPGPGLVMAMAMIEKHDFSDSIKEYLATLPNDKFILMGCLFGGSRIFNNPSEYTHVFNSEAEAHAWWSARHGNIKGYELYHKDASGKVWRIPVPPL